LPAYSKPCTAVINEIVFGEQKSATLFFKKPLPENVSDQIHPAAKQYIARYKGKTIPPMEIELDEMEDYVTIQDEDVEDFDQQAKYIKELPFSKVVVEYPFELCRNGIEIIDSPGLNENEIRTKVTEDYLMNADAILYVFACPKVAGKSDMEYIKNQIHLHGYNDIFFICTKFDQIPEDEQAEFMQHAIKRLSSATSFNEKGIYFVNSSGAIKAKKQKDPVRLNNTGIPQFENSLSEYLRNNKGKVKLLQVINPCINYIDELSSRHIKGFISTLDKDFDEMQKRIEDARPNLVAAQKQKDIAEARIETETENLFSNIQGMVNSRYKVIINKIPEFVKEVELDNKIKILKYKESKEAFESEVVSKMTRFVENEMSNWVQSELNPYIDNWINGLVADIGKDVDVFYDNLDKFKFNVGGVKKPKNITGLERVAATIVGTVVAGPAYGAVGATMGMAEIIKRSVVTMAAFVGLCLTPLSATAIVYAAFAAIIGGGTIQTATAGMSLTQKYKKQLQKSFMEELKNHQEENSENYARSISNKVKEEFSKVTQALANEISIEENKIKALEQDKEKSAEERKKKINELNQLNNELSAIKCKLAGLQSDIE